MLTLSPEPRRVSERLLPERTLLLRARRGDQEAVAELYRHHVGAALKYARAITANTADAEDLVAETFTRVLTQLSMARGPETSFRAYLFTAMRHRLYSSNRRELAVDDQAVLDCAVTDRDTDTSADRELLRQAFATLDARDQELLLLLEVQELRPAEVCARLGLRASALSMRAARARAALAEAYLVAHLPASDEPACRAIRRQLGRHVRGTLSAPRSRAVREHLQACDACADGNTELTEQNRALRAIGIVALPAAAPHGWRAAWAHWGTGRWGTGRRGTSRWPTSHLGAAPTAVKAAVIAASLATGTSAAIAVATASSADHPRASRAVATAPSASRTSRSAPARAGSVTDYASALPTTPPPVPAPPSTARPVTTLPVAAFPVAATPTTESPTIASPTAASPVTTTPESATHSAVPSPTPSAAQSTTPTQTPSPTPSATESAPPTQTPSPTPSATQSATPTQTPSPTPAPTTVTCVRRFTRCWERW